MCQEASYGSGHHHGYCGCREPGHHGMSEHRHHQGGWYHPGHGFRRFHTREEMIARMEDYLKQLRAEAEGVEEYLAELRKQKGEA